eukprot:5628926-Prymnesium_polylepis.1
MLAVMAGGLGVGGPRMESTTLDVGTMRLECPARRIAASMHWSTDVLVYCLCVVFAFCCCCPAASTRERRHSWPPAPTATACGRRKAMKTKPTTYHIGIAPTSRARCRGRCKRQ